MPPKSYFRLRSIRLLLRLRLRRHRGPGPSTWCAWQSASPYINVLHLSAPLADTLDAPLADTLAELCTAMSWARLIATAGVAASVSALTWQKHTLPIAGQLVLTDVHGVYLPETDSVVVIATGEGGVVLKLAAPAANATGTWTALLHTGFPLYWYELIADTPLRVGSDNRRRARATPSTPAVTVPALAGTARTRLTLKIT